MKRKPHDTDFNPVDPIDPVRTVRHVLLVGLAVVVGVSCSQRTPEPVSGPDRKPVVYAVNYPLAYFAERIGGDMVEVRFPAPADVDPAYWSPDADIIAAYQQADRILLNGAGYAEWVKRVSLPSARLVDTGKAFADQWIELEGNISHTHGPGGEHAHGGYAFTTWLDPILAAEQARAVCVMMSEMAPNETDRFEAALAELEGDLTALDSEIRQRTSARPDQPLLFSHPVYQYLERRYGLNGRSVHWEPDKLPDDDMWAELDRILAEHPARWMIWEGPPLPKTEQRLAERGIGSVVFSPCANRPETGEYLSAIRDNVISLEAVFASP